MKKFVIFLILLFTVLTGCHRTDNVQIAATTLPVYEFTVFLCQNTDISVSRLVTENVSCLHDYSVQVDQMRTVEAAQVVVLNGAGLEEFLEDALKHAGNVIDASADLELSCGDVHHHEGHRHAYDPHIWLSPENAKQMCKTICDRLCVMYPAHKTQFEQNLVGIIRQLDDLQAYGETSLKDLEYRDLITFHDGFTYFAESFSLHILKAVEEESGSEASAKELIELIKLVKTNALPAIFTEVNGSTAAAEIISAETGAKVYTLDMAMTGNSYFEAMYHNIDTIKEALG